MSRWRLNSAHYLNTVAPTEWEHQETSRETGKSIRQRYIVPLYMDPRDPADHNYPGEIIVALESGDHRSADILIHGNPTPEMEPLDDEAQALTDELRNRWDHPIDSLPTTMSGEESVFMTQMMAAFAKVTGQTANAPVAASADEVRDLKALVEDLQAQLATIRPSSAIETDRRL